MNIGNVRSILHFTRLANLTGILHAGMIINRAHFQENIHIDNNPILEHLMNNMESMWPRQRDEKWWGYVNLSVNSPNETLFNKAKKSRPNDQWVMLEFSPDLIRNREDVFYTDTNNAYEFTQRKQGSDGIEIMFCDSYRDQYTIRKRNSLLEKHFPTSQQAEILFPKCVDLRHLTAIYTEDRETAREVDMQISSTIEHNTTRINLAPQVNAEKFKANQYQGQY